MALTKGVNSYASLDEAIDFFQSRIDCLEWHTANTQRREEALVTATMLLDTFNFIGYVEDVEQPLAFPRTGVFYRDPRLGSDVYLTGTPRNVIYSTCELALHMLKNEDLLADTGSVSMLSAGPVDLSDIKSPSKMPDHVFGLIKPLLNRGSNHWWRAN